jgi:hypothetical protein
VLNRNRWSSRAVARRLLALLVTAFVPNGPVVVGIDETLERRWGRRIKARGLYRDPVRSSRGHFVKASGLRWLTVMLLAPIPWAGRVWALPFLTVLAPSKGYARQHAAGTRGSPTGGARCSSWPARWLPDRRVVVGRPRPERAAIPGPPRPGSARVAPGPVPRHRRSPCGRRSTFRLQPA